MPWLNNAGYAWKDRTASEYYAHNILHEYVMYREGRWKYTYHGAPAEGMPIQRQLFVMIVDPHELYDLSSQKEHGALIAELHKKMIKEVGGDPDETELRSRMQLAQGYSDQLKIELNGTDAKGARKQQDG